MEPAGISSKSRVVVTLLVPIMFGHHGFGFLGMFQIIPVIASGRMTLAATLEHWTLRLRR